MEDSGKLPCVAGSCNGCNVMNASLIVPVHKMKEEDFRKLGIDYWSSDFGDVFSNGT